MTHSRHVPRLLSYMFGRRGVMVAHDEDDDRDGERTLKLFAAVFVLCTVVGVVAYRERWYIPIALVGAAVALAVAGVTVAIVGDKFQSRLRRCPRCARRGFATVFESEKEGLAGELFFHVRHCARCGLYRLECGPEVRDLDPGRWEKQVSEWLESSAEPAAAADRGLIGE